MSDDAELERLAQRAGILPAYRDAWGQRREVSAATKRALLAAMNLPAGTPEEIASSLAKLEGGPWRSPLPPVLVVRQTTGAQLGVPLVLPEGIGAFAWSLEQEAGARHEGTLSPEGLPLLESRALEGRRLERRLLSLPFALPLGYHRLRLALPDGEAEMPLIVVPRRCHGPAEGEPPRRHWGLALQLYGLRSRRNWGIGDYTDLAGLGRLGGRLGADLVGVNPLHALFPSQPGHVSPYSPSHRAFFGIWNLDLEAVPEFADCAEARARLELPAFRQRLEALRQLPLVDYPAVAAAKRPVLELLYRQFRERTLSDGGERALAFQSFRARGGEALERFARFQALEEHCKAQSWQQWPQAFHDPDSPAVNAFAAEHRERVEFFQYLQFLAEEQLAAAGAAMRGAGMEIGLYGDLALAPDGGGAEAWSNRALMAEGASLGAPPDDWNQKGQDWGLKPYDPCALRRAAFRPFVEMLRANMRHFGALRIDHVMALERLFWIPHGAPPTEGGYVRYPVDELFGILALESRRHDCLVIGEDLGTLPDGFQARMRDAGVLSYRLLYFAQDESGFLPPQHYPEPAAVAVSTHDLAPLAGYWTGRDLELRDRLDLFPDAAAKAAAATRRAHDRIALVRALKREGLLKPEHPDEAEALTFELVLAVHRFLARTPSRLLLLQLEEATGEAEPVNLPGTWQEHPNWRRKTLRDLEDLARDPRLRTLADAIERERGTGAGR